MTSNGWSVQTSSGSIHTTNEENGGNLSHPDVFHVAFHLFSAPFAWRAAAAQAAPPPARRCRL